MSSSASSASSASSSEASSSKVKIAYAKLEGKFVNKDQTVHEFVRYIDALPATLGRSREPRPQEKGGYFHIGDSKNISREAVRISYDLKNTSFMLEVMGKSSVVVDGKAYSKDDPPAVLKNMSAIRIGQGSSQGTSRFYFLLPLDKPKTPLGNLIIMVAEELNRAGNKKFTGRAVASAVKDKYPFYGSEGELSTLPRRAVNFMKKSSQFEKNGLRGRSNLFKFVGAGESQPGADGDKVVIVDANVNSEGSRQPDGKVGVIRKEGRREEIESEPAKRRRIA